MLYFLTLSGIINSISAFVFGLFVYFKNRQSQINRSYGLLSLSLVIWSVAYCFWPLAKTRTQALNSFQWLHAGAILVVPSYVWFIFALLNKTKQYAKVIKLTFLLSVFFLLVLPTRLYIRDMIPQYIFNYWAVPGVMYHWYLVFWFGFTGFAAFHLLREIKISSGSRREQLRYVLIASLFGFLGGATNYLPWYRIYIPPFGTILVSVHIAILAYAIVKHRLMDITLVVTRTVLFIAVYLFVLGIPFLLTTLGRNYLINSLGPSWWLVPFIMLGLLATLGPFIYIYLQKRAEAVILREQRNYRRVLEQAARQLASIHNLKRLLNLITHIVTRTARISFAAVYLYEEASKAYILKAARNFKNEVSFIHQDGVLAAYFKTKKTPLAYEEVIARAQEEETVFKELERLMRALNATLIVPGYLRHQLLGFLVLGNKRSGNFYTAEDLNTFSILANEAALAIENARLYENMEQEIAKRTDQLVEVQRQLVQAEKLATVGTLAGGVAHEINNPLTAILTNVQMLLLDTDKFDSETRESLQLMEEATKRCRTIVQKLMLYSRKPQEAKEFNLVDMRQIIDNVLSFLKYQLEQENISLLVKAEENNYTIYGDANELEQVVTNILLNARDAIKKIKKVGKIEISLSKTKDKLRVSIQDEGTGIPKEIMPRIFDPFFTTKDVGKGLGLGLSICQAIVEKHKGSISVTSELNKGSIFTVELPLAVTNK